MVLGDQALRTTNTELIRGPSQGSVLPWFYLLPLLLPAGGFFSWRRGPPVPKPTEGWLDMPKVRPAEGLMPGLLKLKPELLLLPKPGKAKDDRELLKRIRGK